MIFASSTDPQTKSLRDLVVFCHEDKPVLVPLPATYEDAITLVRREFYLRGPLLLETKDLSGCDGLSVRIHKEAWTSACKIFTRVYVFTLEGDEEQVEEHERQPTVKAEVAPIGSNKAHKGPNRGPGTSTGVPLRHATLEQGFNTVPSVPTPKFNANQRVHIAPIAPSHSNDTSQAQTKRTQTIGLEEEEDQPIRSPKKATRAIRNRVQSDDEFEDVGVNELPRQELNRSPSSQDPSPTERKITRAAPLAAIEQPPAYDDMSEERRTTSAGSKVSQIKTEKMVDERSFKSASSQESQPPAARTAIQEMTRIKSREEDTFVVTIEFGEEASFFKTRGRHLVSKVLSMACKTFGIEDLYPRAQLILVVEEDEGEGIVEHQFECDGQDTMAKAGAKPDARFVIVLDSHE